MRIELVVPLNDELRLGHEDSEQLFPISKLASDSPLGHCLLFVEIFEVLARDISNPAL